MAPGSVAADFNAIINKDRQRRKNQALATEIFSKGRRQSAPGGLSKAGGSLASRVGIQKRTTFTPQKNAPPRSNPKPAAGNVNAEWTHDLHNLNNPKPRAPQVPPRGPTQQLRTKTERLYASLSNSASSPALNAQFNVVGAAKSSSMSIRGLAGPYIVVAKNFAQGTTADDIESALTPVGGACLSCRITSERPHVIAEIIFESKEGADNVVSTFNNQNADGNLLHVYLKNSPSAKPSSTPTAPKPRPRAEDIIVIDDHPDNNRPGRRNDSNHYSPRRNDRRRDYDARDKVVDGSYGFEDRMDTDDDRGGRGLYSDNLVAGGGRGRERGRGYDRGRGYR